LGARARRRPRASAAPLWPGTVPADREPLGVYQYSTLLYLCGAGVVSATRGHRDLRRAVAYRISGDAHRTVSLRIRSTPEAPARGQSSDVVHHGVRIAAAGADRTRRYAMDQSPAACLASAHATDDIPGGATQVGGVRDLSFGCLLRTGAGRGGENLLPTCVLCHVNRSMNGEGQGRYHAHELRTTLRHDP